MKKICLFFLFFILYSLFSVRSVLAACTPTNIACGKSAIANSVNWVFYASHVTDGEYGCNYSADWPICYRNYVFWSNGPDPNWIYVDLGSVQRIGKVKLLAGPGNGNVWSSVTATIMDVARPDMALGTVFPKSTYYSSGGIIGDWGWYTFDFLPLTTWNERYVVITSQGFNPVWREIEVCALQQSCPTTCHTNYQYVPDGNCGQTTCPPNPPAAQSCPTTCHTNNIYVYSGTSCSKTKLCPPNPPAAQSCPTYCGYPGGYVYDGTSCTPTRSCPAIPTPQCTSNTQCDDINACTTDTCTGSVGSCTRACSHTNVAQGTCPTACGSAATTVCNGSGGTTSCPAVPTPQCTSNADCSASCGATGTCVGSGTCTAYCVSNPLLANSAGIVQSQGTIDAGNGKISLGGTDPGYRLTTYTNRVPDLSYTTFRSNVLKNAGVGTVEALDTILKARLPSQPYTVGNYVFWSYSDTSSLETAINYAKATAGTTHIILPRIGTINSASINTANVIVPAGKKIVVFVNGSLTVNKNICDNSCSSAPTDTASSIVFILNNYQPTDKGDLTLLPTVTRLDGVYIFPGAFDDGGGAAQLVGYGSLIGTDSNYNLGDGLLRTFSTGSAPAEQWFYQAKYLSHYKNVLATPTYTWSEQLPQ